MLNLILYLIPGLIWGSTWLVIKFQLGVVDPLVSVGYRFVLAGAILLPVCRLTGLNLKFSGQQHRDMALLGMLLFGGNYWLVYLAEETLSSGIVAVVFSSIVFMNILNSALFLKTRIQGRTIMSAVLGITGIILVFQNELRVFELRSEGAWALTFAILSVISASFGNIWAARNQKRNLPVIQSNGFGMLYGGGLMLLLSVIAGKPLVFDTSAAYTGSLLYLSVFGSVVAFGCYLSLVGRIGPDKAGFISLIFPVVALVLSTWFEGYRWTAMNLVGVSLILVGNFFVLSKARHQLPQSPKADRT